MFFDVSNGKREAVDERLATELVAPLLSSADPVTGFRLTNKVWPWRLLAMILFYRVTQIHSVVRGRS
jgi:hypothetical protein